jgi:PPM family protein phosphatase
VSHWGLFGGALRLSPGEGPMTVRQSFGFPLSVEVGTDVGRIRDNNEDSVGFGWLDDGSLFVIVADGMGGHEAGEVASSLAVRVSEDIVRQDPDADPRDRLHNALLEANQAILEEGASSGTRGMGTTAICAILKGNQVFVAQVGDSRCYHFRKGHKIWRSTDHTRVQMLVDEGKLTEDQARHHPEAGMLTRALGHARMADGQPLMPAVVDHPLVLEPGDTLLLCSDGLHDLLEDHEIGRIIAGKSSTDAIADLISAACDRGGHDNITVAMINAGARVQQFDPSYHPPNASPRAGAAGAAGDHPTFDVGDQGGFGAGGGHLHAPTVAPGEEWEPSPVPPSPRARVATGRPSAADPDEAAPPGKSRTLLIVGVVAVLLLGGLGVLGCGGAVVAWFMLNG